MEIVARFYQNRKNSQTQFMYIHWIKNIIRQKYVSLRFVTWSPRVVFSPIDLKISMGCIFANIISYEA